MTDDVDISDEGHSMHREDLPDPPAGSPKSLRLDLAGQPVTIAIVPTASPPASIESWLTVFLDDEPCRLGLSPVLTTVLSRPFGALPQAADPVTSLCASLVLDPVLQALEGTVCERCRIETWERKPLQDQPDAGLVVTVTLDDGTSETATVHLTEDLTARLKPWFVTEPDNGSPDREFIDESSPTTGHVSLARVRVLLSHLPKLEIGGAILLGRAFDERQDVALTVGRHRFACRLGESYLEILSPIEKSPLVVDPLEVEVDVVLDDVPLDSLALKKTSISGFEPGAILDLPSSFGRFVTLLVDDQPIGRGQIVNVNGALAAQIVDLTNGSS